MRTPTIVITVTLVAAAGLIGCFPRHSHHGTGGNIGWNQASWSGSWNGPGWDDDDRDGSWARWGDGDWDDGDQGHDGWDDNPWSDDYHWHGPCHPANNFCGNHKPWW